MQTVTSKGHAVKKVQVYGGVFVVYADRALMLCTCVYISEQILGRGSKTKQKNGQTAAQTHITLYTCEWCCAEGAVIRV